MATILLIGIPLPLNSMASSFLSMDRGINRGANMNMARLLADARISRAA
jgi:hypothetical protein